MQRRSPDITALSATSRAVLRTLLDRGPLPRAEIARRLGLSPASITKAARGLSGAGLIDTGTPAAHVGAAAHEGRGRPTTPIRAIAEQIQFIGVKITGEEIYVVRVDAVGTVLAERNWPLNERDADAVVDVISNAVDPLATGHPVHAVGVGSAGTMHLFDDHVRRNVYLGWDKVPLARLLQVECGIPTVVSRDVDALTTGIHTWGPHRGESHLAMLTIGVGIGIGLALEGRIQTGADGRAGLISHTSVNPGGPECGLGHRGCAEALLTTDAITQRVGRAVGEEQMSLERVGELADRGEASARKAIDEAAYALAVLIAGIANLLDIRALALTGDGLPVLDRAAPDIHNHLIGLLDRSARLPAITVYRSGFDEWARGAAAVARLWTLTNSRS